MSKIVQFSLALLMVVALLAVSGMTIGCPGPKSAVTEWDIPFISVLTGPAAFAGLPAVWGAEYAADLINADGGINGVPVKFTTYDTAFDNAKAVTAMGRAVEGSLVVFGPMDGNGAPAAGPVAVEAGVPFIAALTRADLREQFAPWGVSYMQDDADGMPLAVTEWLKLNPDIKSIALFYYPADPTGADTYNELRDTLPELGVELLGTIEVASGELDMGPAVVKAMNLNADGYYCELRAGEYARVATEMYTRGMTEGRRLCSAFAAFSPELFDLAEGYLDGTYIWNKMDVNYPSDAWAALVEVYKADYDGKSPSIAPVVGYCNAVYAVKVAFETLDITGDPAKLVEERTKIANFFFNSQEFEGIQGNFHWVEGEFTAPFFFFKIQDNAPVKLSDITVE